MCGGGGCVVVVNACVMVVVDVLVDVLNVCPSGLCEMFAGTREALEIVGMSINFRSGKFGYSICPIFSKGHAEIFREFWHDFC